MNKISLLGLLIVSLFNAAHAADDAPPVAPIAPAAQVALGDGNFCLFSGTPPSDYKFKVVKEVKVAKGAYGPVTQILPAFVAQAKEAGADAIVNYAGSQRFGFFPWRLVRPVVRGTAVKFEGTEPIDCAKMGGTTLSNIISANKAPEK
jgi:hypothetical protein